MAAPEDISGGGGCNNFKVFPGWEYEIFINTRKIHIIKIYRPGLFINLIMLNPFPF